MEGEGCREFVVEAEGGRWRKRDGERGTGKKIEEKDV